MTLLGVFRWTPKIGRVLIDELLEDVANDYRANGRRTVKDVERRWKLHLQPVFGGRPGLCRSRQRTSIGCQSLNG